MDYLPRGLSAFRRVLFQEFARARAAQDPSSHDDASTTAQAINAATPSFKFPEQA